MYKKNFKFFESFYQVDGTYVEGGNEDPNLAPLDAPPADTPPADTPPADTPPADTPPADAYVQPDYSVQPDAYVQSDASQPDASQPDASVPPDILFTTSDAAETLPNIPVVEFTVPDAVTSSAPTTPFENPNLLYRVSDNGYTAEGYYASHFGSPTDIILDGRIPSFDPYGNLINYGLIADSPLIGSIITGPFIQQNTTVENVQYTSRLPSNPYVSGEIITISKPLQNVVEDRGDVFVYTFTKTVDPNQQDPNAQDASSLQNNLFDETSKIIEQSIPETVIPDTIPNSDVVNSISDLESMTLIAQIEIESQNILVNEMITSFEDLLNEQKQLLEQNLGDSTIQAKIDSLQLTLNMAMSLKEQSKQIFDLQQQIMKNTTESLNTAQIINDSSQVITELQTEQTINNSTLDYINQKQNEALAKKTALIEQINSLQQDPAQQELINQLQQELNQLQIEIDVIESTKNMNNDALNNSNTNSQVLNSLNDVNQISASISSASTELIQSLGTINQSFSNNVNFFLSMLQAAREISSNPSTLQTLESLLSEVTSNNTIINNQIDNSTQQAATIENANKNAVQISTVITNQITPTATTTATSNPALLSNDYVKQVRNNINLLKNEVGKINVEVTKLKQESIDKKAILTFAINAVAKAKVNLENAIKSVQQFKSTSYEGFSNSYYNNYFELNFKNNYFYETFESDPVASAQAALDAAIQNVEKAKNDYKIITEKFNQLLSKQKFLITTLSLASKKGNKINRTKLAKTKKSSKKRSVKSGKKGSAKSAKKRSVKSAKKGSAKSAKKGSVKSAKKGSKTKRKEKFKNIFWLPVKNNISIETFMNLNKTF
jgi:hypothetical protein